MTIYLENMPIAELIAERDAKVQEIKEKYPYSEVE